MVDLAATNIEVTDGLDRAAQLGILLAQGFPLPLRAGLDQLLVEEAKFRPPTEDFPIEVPESVRKYYRQKSLLLAQLPGTTITMPLHYDIAFP